MKVISHSSGIDQETFLPYVDVVIRMPVMLMKAEDEQPDIGKMFIDVMTEYTNSFRN